MTDTNEKILESTLVFWDFVERLKYYSNCDALIVEFEDNQTLVFKFIFKLGIDTFGNNTFCDLPIIIDRCSADQGFFDLEISILNKVHESKKKSGLFNTGQEL